MRPRQELTFREEPQDGGVVVYRLAGDLFGTSEGYRFQNAVRDGVAAGQRRIVLDCGELGRIDSSGVGILVAVMWSASNGGASLALAAVPSIVEKVLGLAMLLPRIAHAPSVEEARKLVESSGS